MTMQDLFKSRKFWITIVLCYPVILAMTMYKDFYFTDEKPNILFYLTVPEAG